MTQAVLFPSAPVYTAAQLRLIDAAVTAMYLDHFPGLGAAAHEYTEDDFNAAFAAAMVDPKRRAWVVCEGLRRQAHRLYLRAVDDRGHAAWSREHPEIYGPEHAEKFERLADAHDAERRPYHDLACLVATHGVPERTPSHRSPAP